MAELDDFQVASHNFSRHLEIPCNFLSLKMLTTRLGNGTQILDYLYSTQHQ